MLHSEFPKALVYHSKGYMRECLAGRECSRGTSDLSTAGSRAQKENQIVGDNLQNYTLVTPIPLVMPHLQRVPHFTKQHHQLENRYSEYDHMRTVQMLTVKPGWFSHEGLVQWQSDGSWVWSHVTNLH